MWSDGIHFIIVAQSLDLDDHPLLKLLPVLIFVGLSLLSKLAKAGAKKSKPSRPVSAPPTARPPAGVQSPPAGPIRKPLPPYAQKSNLPYAVKAPPSAQSGTREIRPAPRPAAQVPRTSEPVPRLAMPSRSQVPSKKPVLVPRPAASRSAPPAPATLQTPPSPHPVGPSEKAFIPPSVRQEVPQKNKPPERQVRGEQPKSVTQQPSESPAGPSPAAVQLWMPNFSRPQALAQAVIYSEILGRPVGLRSASFDEF